MPRKVQTSTCRTSSDTRVLEWLLEWDKELIRYLLAKLSSATGDRRKALRRKARSIRGKGNRSTPAR